MDYPAVSSRTFFGIVVKGSSHLHEREACRPRAASSMLGRGLIETADVGVRSFGIRHGGPRTDARIGAAVGKTRLQTHQLAQLGVGQFAEATRRTILNRGINTLL